MAITGTRTGIGRGLAEHFLRSGYVVAGCSRGPSSLDAPGYDHVCIDVGNEPEVRQWVRHVKNTLGRIDVLVSNAGLVHASTPLMITSGSTLDAVVRTNFYGTYYVCREVAKVMILQRSGRIITMSSMAAGLHEEGTSAYSASKSAVVEMTKVLAKELGPFGITCNVIAPSIIDTCATESMGSAVAAHALQRLTLKRKLTVEEICHVVNFLASPLSACVTGQIIQLGLVT
jgi:3-oxoacyl-[acyl-carrier protein] reductase